MISTQLRLISKTLFTLWVGLIASTTSHACDSCQIMLAAQQHSTFQSHIYKSMNDSNAERRRSENSRDSTSTPTKQQNAPNGFVRAKGRASATNNPLPYDRDLALSAKLREDFIVSYAQQDPDATASMRNMTQQNDLVQVMAGFIQLQGLDSASMENLIAFWYGQGWAVAHQKPLPTAEQFQAIAAQVQRHFDKSPVLKNMGNAARQTFFEQNAYALFITKANYEAYLKRGKTDVMARMAVATQESFKKMGLDLQKLQLTARGLVPL
jgi:hypothetical protein